MRDAGKADAQIDPRIRHRGGRHGGKLASEDGRCQATLVALTADTYDSAKAARKTGHRHPP
jgi:hypothetical protein